MSITNVCYGYMHGFENFKALSIDLINIPTCVYCVTRYAQQTSVYWIRL